MAPTPEPEAGTTLRPVPGDGDKPDAWHDGYVTMAAKLDPILRSYEAAGAGEDARHLADARLVVRGCTAFAVAAALVMLQGSTVSPDFYAGAIAALHDAFEWLSR